MQMFHLPAVPRWFYQHQSRTDSPHILIYAGDVTHHELKLVHIKRANEIKGYLLKTSEEARIKRRTLSTIDISAHDCDGVAGVEETIDNF